jgi:hypothetical protein
MSSGERYAEICSLNSILLIIHVENQHISAFISPLYITISLFELERLNLVLAISNKFMFYLFRWPS